MQVERIQAALLREAGRHGWPALPPILDIHSAESIVAT
jgi:hypothetical protein